jgi:hypothetical protein
MGYSRDAQLDLLRGAVLDLAKGAGVHIEPSVYPSLAKLLAFDRECEANLAAAAAEAERRGLEQVERFTRPDERAQAFADFEAENAARIARGLRPRGRLVGSGG